MSVQESNLVVGLVGLGTIGRSWAEVFLRAGMQVKAYDPLSDLDAIDGYDGSFEKVAELSSLQQCHYIQESLPEDPQIKLSICEELDAWLPDTCVVASSSSAIPISSIVKDLPGQARFLIAHPANPPHLLRIVELVPSEFTSQSTVDSAAALMRRVGQVPVILKKEIDGFLLNRLQYALFKECVQLVNDGVASYGDVDAVVTDGLGMRWAFFGPFEVEAMNAPTVRANYMKFLPTIERLMEAAEAPLNIKEGFWERTIEAYERRDDLADRRAKRNELLSQLGRLKEEFGV